MGEATARVGAVDCRTPARACASKPGGPTLPDSHKLKSRFVDRAPRRLRVSTFSGPDAKRGKGKHPPVEWVNAVEPGAGRAGDILSLLSVRCRQQAHCPMRFLFPIFKICAIASLGSLKGREHGRSEAGMDCGTALAKQARLSPYREALRRRIFARPRALAPAAEGRVGEKSGSQSNSQAIG